MIVPRLDPLALTLDLVPTPAHATLDTMAQGSPVLVSNLFLSPSRLETSLDTLFFSSFLSHFPAALSSHQLL